MDGMDMSSTSSSTSTKPMTMVFHTNLDTPLFSNSLTPKNAGQFFGVLILLIIMGFSFRLALAIKQQMEHRWREEQGSRRVVIASIDGPGNSSSRSGSGSSTEGVRERKSMQAEERDGRIAAAEGATSKERRRMEVAPWRWQVDGIRGLMTFGIAGLGYLLMLAVMTMNVGYFFAVLGGILFGELAFGRYITSGGDH